MKLFYSDSYVASEHAFDTTRKAEWIAQSLLSSPINGVQIVEPGCISEDQLSRIHDPEYVRAVKTGQPRDRANDAGFPWEPALWEMTASSTGGVVAAAMAALDDGVAGSLSSGLHHARHSAGAGFCTFNGLALAAIEALDHDAGSVLILDLDAHCGGGTHSIVGAHPSIRHVDVSVSSFDQYEPAVHNSLSVVYSSEDYLPIIERELGDIETGRERFGLCLYNAGMDPYEGCDIGGLSGIGFEQLEQREQMVFEWARRLGMPVAFVLAGGYAGPRLPRERLVDLHGLTIGVASANAAKVTAHSDIRV